VSFNDRLLPESGRAITGSGGGGIEHLFLDYSEVMAGEATRYENRLAATLSAAYPFLKSGNLGAILGNMRRIKDAGELATIREAVRITGKGIEGILEELKPGVNERLLEARFEYEIRKEGAEGSAFHPIVAGGKNAVVLHYNANNQDLPEQGLLLLDLGASFLHYSADLSRTYPITGLFSAEEAYYYQGVLAAQEAVIAALKPGLQLEKTTDIAREALYPFCKDKGDAKSLEDMKKLLPHGVCHYMGLDTHDVGDRDLLEPGMVLTIEPGVYLPEKGIGIRIEDDAIITAEGCEVPAAGVPRMLDEI
jgi:Xaa-Pro aminopeptidase